MKNKYSRIFAIIKQVNEAGGAVTKESLVSDFTNGRTTSLSDLSFSEYQEFERNLVSVSRNKNNAHKPNSKSHEHDPNDATRKAIIAQFKSIGRSTQDAISWCERYGVRGLKKSFNSYSGQELYILLQNAKKVKTAFIKSVSNKV